MEGGERGEGEEHLKNNSYLVAQTTSPSIYEEQM